MDAFFVIRSLDVPETNIYKDIWYINDYLEERCFEYNIKNELTKNNISYIYKLVFILFFIIYHEQTENLQIFGNLSIIHIGNNIDQFFTKENSLKRVFSTIFHRMKAHYCVINQTPTNIVFHVISSNKGNRTMPLRDMVEINFLFKNNQFVSEISLNGIKVAFSEKIISKFLTYLLNNTEKTKTYDLFNEKILKNKEITNTILNSNIVIDVNELSEEYDKNNALIDFLPVFNLKSAEMFKNKNTIKLFNGLLINRDLNDRLNFQKEALLDTPNNSGLITQVVNKASQTASIEELTFLEKNALESTPSQHINDVD